MWVPGKPGNCGAAFLGNILHYMAASKHHRLRNSKPRCISYVLTRQIGEQMGPCAMVRDRRTSAQYNQARLGPTLEGMK